MNWEYGYLHRVVSYAPDSGMFPVPASHYALQVSSGLQLIDNVEDQLEAFNACGAEGWIVQVPEVWNQLPAPIIQFVSEQVDGEAKSGITYFMRREV